MPHFPGWVVGGGIGKLRQVAEAFRCLRLPDSRPFGLLPQHSRLALCHRGLFGNH
ncbi:MAG TPA: hypothetical protein IAA26_01200 [Candidatus Blautia faecipullorum]|nr:hypothetical protein [Candidatus Blautia faecipullorum]